MSFFADLRTALLQLPAVSAIVGAGSSARIWNGWARTYATPCVVMDLDSAEDQNDLSGTAGGVIGEGTLTCRADTSDQADALRTAVRGGMAGYSGAFTLIFDDTTYTNTPRGDGSTAHWFDRILSFTAIWTE